MLNIANLNLGFGGPAQVVAEATCSVADGQRLLICGAAGSGKTTFLNAAAGLIPRLLAIPYFSGDVTLRGRPVSTIAKDELFSTVGFVSQNVEDQLWDLSVEDAIAFPMENRGIDKEKIRARLEELIDGLRLAPLLGRRVLTLSGGERRMVAIAAALASNPALLVLDEPTTGLDPQARERLSRTLREAAASVSALLVSEQDPASLRSVVDTIVLLKERRLSAPYRRDDILPLERPWLEAGILPPNRTRSQRKPANPGAVLLEISGLTTRLARSDGKPVLRDVGFQIRAGEAVALIGRNGAGKTTLFKSILGLARIASGSILLDGADADGWTAARRARKVAYVPQNMRHILFNMTVIGEVVFSITASTATTADKAVADRAAAMLARYGLSGLAQANPFALSARQLALLGLACADAAGAPVAIVDEPLLARDVEGRRMLDIFLSSMLDSGRAVMLISHDLELVDDVATRLMILDDGGIAFDGAVMDGWKSPTFAALGWAEPYATPKLGGVA
ncbi:ABC transporter ATP-binding protein [Mesorhizobium helmanticense]|uniref:Sugar ABC transporter n=1 Tax=Mesorhizobium helmanticense TaxID=1776423 RepID=A0A2T4J185_9HYPH|nr:ABC transporter ATP-binding protein [Mesorhizobium helmanticense]PTE11597.1 sugar ABC transporter [Mesorhizobium helmanticense]